MLRELFGTAGVFPIRGAFCAPVFMPFELSPGSIVYLGRIEATIRARRSDDELRAGPLVPLIDQAVSGLFGGTFEIRISDNYEGDVVPGRRRAHDGAGGPARLEPTDRGTDEVKRGRITWRSRARARGPRRTARASG